MENKKQVSLLMKYLRPARDSQSGRPMNGVLLVDPGRIRRVLEDRGILLLNDPFSSRPIRELLFRLWVFLPSDSPRYPLTRYLQEFFTLFDRPPTISKKNRFYEIRVPLDNEYIFAKVGIGGAP